MKTAETCCSKMCVHFGYCCGNQDWAERVENHMPFLKLVHLKSQKVSTLYLKVFLRYFRKFTQGGGHSVPPALTRVK